ncbi:MAG: DUF4837 family protein [Bacteroidetes bacterium]|nr:DUF4837 family protein [Bacteroidota bacterium]
MKKIAILILFAFLASCKTGESPKQPSASGKAGELLLIMDSNNWKGEAGEGFKSVFAANIPMFPQAEPLFNIIQIEEKAFTKIFESHRHIFIAEINPNEEKAKIEIGKNVWSHPQIVIKVIAPAVETFNRTIIANAQTFIDYYLKAEYERNINANKLMQNMEVMMALEKDFGIKMVIPQGFYIAKKTENFMWIRRTGTIEDLEMSILVSILPYRDADFDFNPNTIWTRRDSLTKLHIPGQLEGSFMTTYNSTRKDDVNIPPISKEINFNGKYAVETSGLWRTQGDHMGGPFIGYTIAEDNGKFLLYLDAFVYYPNKGKRNFMRQLQSIIYSLEFVK